MVLNKNQCQCPNQYFNNTTFILFSSSAGKNSVDMYEPSCRVSASKIMQWFKQVKAFTKRAYKPTTYPFPLKLLWPLITNKGTINEHTLDVLASRVLCGMVGLLHISPSQHST